MPVFCKPDFPLRRAGGSVHIGTGVGSTPADTAGVEAQVEGTVAAVQLLEVDNTVPVAGNTLVAAAVSEDLKEAYIR